jgi:hypothetical protein
VFSTPFQPGTVVDVSGKERFTGKFTGTDAGFTGCAVGSGAIAAEFLVFHNSTAPTTKILLIGCSPYGILS